MANDPMNVNLSLLCKLGSIAVHAQEVLGTGAHPFDAFALQELLNDPEVRQWMDAMNAQALLPVPR